MDISNELIFCLIAAVLVVILILPKTNGSKTDLFSRFCGLLGIKVKKDIEYKGAIKQKNKNIEIFINLPCYNPNNVIGVKITHRGNFDKVLQQAVAFFDFKQDRVKGTYCLPLPSCATRYVSSAVGETRQSKKDHKIVLWKGCRTALLKREFALKPGKVYVRLCSVRRYLNSYGNPLNIMDKGVWLLEREKVVMRTIYILTDVIVIPADWIIDQVEPLDPLTLVRNLTISDGMEERFPDCFSQKKSFDVVENVSDFHNRYTVVTD